MAVVFTLHELYLLLISGFLVQLVVLRYSSVPDTMRRTVPPQRFHLHAPTQCTNLSEREKPLLGKEGSEHKADELLFLPLAPVPTIKPNTA